VTARKLDQSRHAFRIGDPAGQFKIFSGAGAARVEGRWHDKGQSVIYTAENFSLALLEKLVHFNGILPDGQHFIKIEIPAGVSYEVVTKDSVAGWFEADSPRARAHGSRWLREGKSALLFVPSVVAREEQNLLLNPAHKDFAKIKAGLETPIVWDQRLFAKR
jgi:RES domain-containing protein